LRVLYNKESVALKTYDADFEGSLVKAKNYHARVGK